MPAAPTHPIRRSAIALAILVPAFALLALAVARGWTLPFDRALLAALRDPADGAVPAGPPWLLRAAIDITPLGGRYLLTLVTIGVAGFLLASRRPRWAALLILSVSAGAAFGGLLKALFQRPRPDVVAHLVEVSSASFPSAHAMNSAVVYLTLGVFLARIQPTRAQRRFILGFAILVPLLVGATRVYLGVHWPSDVIAGWTVGAIWALLCRMLVETVRRRGVA